MKVSPIHIRVTQAERRLFEGAAEKTGMNMSTLIKKAVVAYLRSPLPKDEIAEALERLETFQPTQAQRARHKEAVRAVDKGELKGLNKKKA